MATINPAIAALRREYSRHVLSEESANPSPILQFDAWFTEALNAAALEPNACTLATAAKDARPSARTVLLKSFDNEGFIFFSNYESRKGRQMEENPFVALCFLWLEIERQVRIEGKVEKISPQASDLYFSSRPHSSRLGAWVSPQSRPITKDELETKMEELVKKYPDEIPRPEHWGGYLLRPDMIEFWQGRPSRLHDRIEYRKEREEWNIRRLAP